PDALDDIVNMMEDEEKDITMIGFDKFFPFPQDGTEDITITQDPSHGDLSGITFTASSDTDAAKLAQWTLTYTPDPNYNGPDSFNYTVYNPNNPNNGGVSDEGTISIDINSINDSPVLGDIANVSINEDSDTTFTVLYSDVEDALIATAFSDSANVVVSINSESESAEITIDATNDYSGSSSVTVTVTEDKEQIELPVSVSSSFVVTINPVNDPPVITSSPSSTDVELGTTFSYQVNVAD
ncbi:uncharacterized protein METZ01_LOCUS488114, partial [marine metagenome]